jgi:hypothetical protein
MIIDTAQHIYEQINGTRLHQLKEALLQSAIAYARIRVDWYTASVDARREMDQHRTNVHNAFIDACNILSRNMAKHGEDSSWRALLGNDRKTIGDFACYLHCLLGLKAR